MIRTLHRHQAHTVRTVKPPGKGQDAGQVLLSMPIGEIWEFRSPWTSFAVVARQTRDSWFWAGQIWSHGDIRRVLGQIVGLYF